MNAPVSLLTVLPLLLLQVANGQKTRTLFYDDILYGKVRQVSSIEYMPKTAGIAFKDTTWYDENGNTVENHRKTEHGTIFKEKYINTNEASGRIMIVISNKADQNLSAKFDAKGNMTEYSSYLKTGRLLFKAVYEYNERNNLVKYRYMDGNSSVKMRRTYQYDKNDNLIGEDNWGASGNVDYHTDFQYKGLDEAGNWTKRLSHKKILNGQTTDGITTDRQITYY